MATLRRHRFNESYLHLPAHSNYGLEAPATHQSARHRQSSTAERICTASLVLRTDWRMFAGQSCPPSTQQKPCQPLSPAPSNTIIPPEAVAAAREEWSRHERKKERRDGEGRRRSLKSSTPFLTLRARVTSVGLEFPSDDRK